MDKGTASGPEAVSEHSGEGLNTFLLPLSLKAGFLGRQSGVPQEVPNFARLDIAHPEPPRIDVQMAKPSSAWDSKQPTEPWPELFEPLLLASITIAEPYVLTDKVPAPAHLELLLFFRTDTSYRE